MGWLTGVPESGQGGEGRLGRLESTRIPYFLPCRIIFRLTNVFSENPLLVNFSIRGTWVAIAFVVLAVPGFATRKRRPPASHHLGRLSVAYLQDTE